MLIVAQHLPTLEEFKFPPCGSGRDDETANIRTGAARDDSGENDCSPVAVDSACLRPCLVGGKDPRRSKHKTSHGGGEKKFDNQTTRVECPTAGAKPLRKGRGVRPNGALKGVHRLEARFLKRVVDAEVQVGDGFYESEVEINLNTQHCSASIF